MVLEYYPEAEIKKQIKEIISKYLDINKYKVFLFGSRITGKSHEHSDIDIGIEGSEPIPSLILGSIKDDLEKLPVLYSFDVVDFTAADEDFKKVALKKIETLYG